MVATTFYHCHYMPPLTSRKSAYNSLYSSWLSFPPLFTCTPPATFLKAKKVFQPGPPVPMIRTDFMWMLRVTYTGKGRELTLHSIISKFESERGSIIVCLGVIFHIDHHRIPIPSSPLSPNHKIIHKLNCSRDENI
jgi:hypothetical protein